MGHSEKYSDEESSDEEFEGPPPDFTVYQAETKTVDNWVLGRHDIASHDAHLNEDPEALYRFILDQVATSNPVLRICLRGYERRQHGPAQVFHVVIDIPIPSALASHPIHWSLADSEPAFRGRYRRQVIKDGMKERSGKAVNEPYIERRNARRELGYPPWLMDAPDDQLPRSICDLPARDATSDEVMDFIQKRAVLERNAYKSSKSVRELAQEYVEASRSIKEFTFNQEVYGWDFGKLEKLMEKSIVEKANRKASDLMTFEHWVVRGRIYVRPASTVSKVMYKLWHSGGNWKTCGVAYPLAGYVDANGDDEGVIKTPSGLKRRAGMTAEEWFQKYEAEIVDAVAKRRESYDPITLPMDG